MYFIAIWLFTFFPSQSGGNIVSPVLTSIDPPFAVQGTTVTVTLKGSGFVVHESRSSSYDFGFVSAPRISGPREVIDENTMIATWRVDAPPGKYFVEVT